ncbi:MAG TPA: ABC transporter ATP-binding protein [Patescibacteria group bacterium]|nr:ABC transporter ATP-binding protein [Patescibacteria group bacterium]
MKMANNPIVYLTRKVWQYSEGNRRWVVFYVCLFVGANIIGFFEPLVVAFILNTIQKYGLTAESLPRIITYLTLFIVLEIAFWIFHGPARVIENKNAFLAKANYKKYLLEGTTALPAEWHTDHHSGDTIDKIEKGTRGLFEYASDSFLVIETVVRFSASYFALVYFNIHAGYIVLAMVLVTLGIILRFDKVLIGQYHQLNRAENKIAEKIFDALSNITTVIILRIEKLITQAVWQKIIQPLGLFVRNNRLNETKWFLVSLCTAIMTFSVLFTYIFTNYRSGSVLLLGTIYVLYGYVQRINGLFFRFAYMYGDIVRQQTAVLNAEEISREFQDNLRSGLIDLRRRPWKELKIEGLSFSYQPAAGASRSLHQISLVIKKGERVAFIGDSGSGKTTLLKLIRSLYKSRIGAVYVDGQKLPQGFDNISENIALIPQEPEIFATTIKENITIGVPRKMAEIRQYTDLVNLSAKIDRLPNQYDSSIVEKGVNLSGGEKQRLALARGLLAASTKEILLLDEPTSSVDAINELKIYRNIFRHFAGKTIISSIHRLHLLPLFDQIFFFANGRLIAQGSFKELLANSDRFRDWWARYHQTERG